jgi:hypothetical protein
VPNRDFAVREAYAMAAPGIPSAFTTQITIAGGSAPKLSAVQGRSLQDRLQLAKNVCVVLVKISRDSAVAEQLYVLLPPFCGNTISGSIIPTSRTDDKI